MLALNIQLKLKIFIAGEKTIDKIPSAVISIDLEDLKSLQNIEKSSFFYYFCFCGIVF